MARGGCQITTATSRIDARLETRLAAILSELMGNERHTTRSPRGGPSHERGGMRHSTPRPEQWAASLVRARERMANTGEIVVEGTLNRMVGMTLEAVGCEAAVGGRCLVDTAEGRQIEAEVVGFSGDKLFLMPTGDIRGIMPGARVIPTRSVSEVAVGDELLGRVLDGAGRPLDGFGELRCADRVSLTGEPLNPLMRRAIRDPLDVGVRSINSTAHAVRAAASASA